VGCNDEPRLRRILRVIVGHYVGVVWIKEDEGEAGLVGLKRVDMKDLLKETLVVR